MPSNVRGQDSSRISDGCIHLQHLWTQTSFYGKTTARTQTNIWTRVGHSVTFKYGANVIAARGTILHASAGFQGCFLTLVATCVANLDRAILEDLEDEISIVPPTERKVAQRRVDHWKARMAGTISINSANT